jgi:predicted NUDIX family NTP pyrophosphohydrolase
MSAHSAGVLLWRRRDGALEVLLGHFGGPHWARKDEGAWAIPKGLIEPGESAEAAARREFAEELGAEAPAVLTPLAIIRQKAGKKVTAFAAEGDFDPAALVSNEMRLEWPPRSGEFQSYPELDRAAWFGMDEARAKMLPSQLPLLDALTALLDAGPR